LADKRKNNGGARKGAGRKPKADELKKLEIMDSKLSPEKAWEELSKLVKGGDINAIKFWIEHRFGKAKETKQIDHTGELNLPHDLVKWADEEE